MKIQSLEIENIAGILDLKLKFNPSMNLICGENGIGKTTVIECIAHTFSGNSSRVLKKNVFK